MRNIHSAFLVLVIITAPGLPLPVQPQTDNRKKIYHDGWIDLNKNGRKDVYEDSRAPIDRRGEDLLSQMNLDEKTCQTATLYGVGRDRSGAVPPLKDELPTQDWKNQISKDGMATIAEHVNGVGTS